MSVFAPPAPPPLRLLLSKRDAARAMDVSERTIDNWRREGKLRDVLIGKHPRFDVRDLHELIDRHKAPAPENLLSQNISTS